MCGYICLKKELHKRRSSFGIKIEWSHCRWEHRNPDSSCNAWHCSYFTQKVAKIQFSAKQKYSTSQNTNWTISSWPITKYLIRETFGEGGGGMIISMSRFPSVCHPFTYPSIQDFHTTQWILNDSTYITMES